MKWILIGLALWAAPVQAQDCFAGDPRQVTYEDGRVITIIQRHGDDLTYTTPYEGFQDSVTKTQLMLFPKQGRAGARSTEYRWSSRLPKLRDLVPGYRFDIKGTMKSGDGEALPYRIAGEVLREEAVMVGECSYPTLVVANEIYLNDEILMAGTSNLSAEMKVVLRSDTVLINAGSQIVQKVIGLK